MLFAMLVLTRLKFLKMGLTLLLFPPLGVPSVAVPQVPAAVVAPGTPDASKSS